MLVLLLPRILSVLASLSSSCFLGACPLPWGRLRGNLYWCWWDGRCLCPTKGLLGGHLGKSQAKRRMALRLNLTTETNRCPFCRAKALPMSGYGRRNVCREVTGIGNSREDVGTNSPHSLRSCKAIFCRRGWIQKLLPKGV